MRRALTLWPEWAWAICELDKRVENRGWALPIGEWIGLHAGKCIGGKPAGGYAGMGSLIEMARRAGWEFIDVGARDTERAIVRPHHRQVDVWANHVPTSALVGAFRVLAADPPGVGDLGGWRVPEAYGNRFEFRRLGRPIPVKGAQGLWTIPLDVLAEARMIGPSPSPPPPDTRSDEPAHTAPAGGSSSLGDT